MAVKTDLTNCRRNTKGTILLVGEKIANSLTKRFLSYGYKIIAVKDGFEALETVRTKPVNLIISGLDLPQMDCLELIMNLRDLNIHSPLVILEDTSREKGTKSISATDVWGYCCAPAVKTTIREVLNCIKDSSKRVDPR
jgi:CheY-like chemotaxis protein